MAQPYGIQQSSYLRDTNVALYDHIVGLLQSYVSEVSIIYGTRVSTVTPTIIASFEKDYNKMPAISMAISDNIQREVGIGQAAVHGTPRQYEGVNNHSIVQIDVWARDRLELEGVSRAVIDTLRRKRNELSKVGIIDMRLDRQTEQGFDPNSPKIWYGFAHAPGELWMKEIKYTVIWSYVWSPLEEEGIGEIKKIDTFIEQNGAVVEDSHGLAILGLLDSLYYTRYIGERIMVLRKRGVKE